ncbi:hypothetical protein HY772_06815 [Candidatus Woesearchaeota archaeon]|nr:hypothetical protein [Candidatus Woesearchaeota archaeon]
MTQPEALRQRARKLDRGIVLVIGIAVLLFVIFIWRDAETTLLMLFLIGIFYPLAAIFVLVVALLTFRALRSKDLGLAFLCGASILYIVLWIIALQRGIYSYSEFRTSFLVVVSLAYAVICIGFALVTLRRIKH